MKPWLRGLLRCLFIIGGAALLLCGAAWAEEETTGPYYRYGSEDGPAVGDTVILPAEKPTRDGYNFGGYTVRGNASGKIYKAGETVEITADMAQEGEPIVFEARWTQPVAVYHENDTGGPSLIFYDNMPDDEEIKKHGSGTPEKYPTGDTHWDTQSLNYDQIPWTEKAQTIHTVKFVGHVAPVSTAFWFRSFTALESFEPSNPDTSNVTNMQVMFAACTALTSVDFSGVDTSSVTMMMSIFGGCTALTELDLSDFDMGSIASNGITNMFANCSSLVTIYGNDWVTGNEYVSSAQMVFGSCNPLVGGDGTSRPSTGGVDGSHCHPNAGGYFTDPAKRGGQ